MAIVRWVLLVALAFGFLLLAVSNWTPVDFILPDGSVRAVPLPLLLGLAFLAGVIPTWAWMAVRPLAPRRAPLPRGERTEVAPAVSAATQS
ncbi:hypothetical protein [Sandarakinorhabdus rubra]|uniref:hypothetical protein n=1 Tax=Sandarakinorhabdus rubra TaxID=2672568 RepID=UPI0013DAAB09|nr:hypothetical protein [Sandarakinorhabdus rubra]